MKTLHLRLFFVAIIVCYAITTTASPAFPGLIKKQQPDGSTISLYMKGDEKVHWMESEDGYSLLYSNNRTIVYATADKEGNMLPSPVVARDVSLRSVSDQSFLKDVPKRLKYSTSQINTLKSIWEIAPKSSNAVSNQFRSSSKTVNAICALVGFSDKPLVKTRADFDVLMNQSGYSAPEDAGTSNKDNGSVNDYYMENSYGQINLVVKVAGPYTLSKPWAYYGANDANGNDSISRVHEFAAEAARLTFTDPAIIPANYDNDGNGSIDAFHIIYAGYGEESGGDPHCIWAHESGFYPALTFGTKYLDTYSCSPELRGYSGSNITHIGVVCHEMAHIFGALDFYDVDGDANGGYFEGTGQWDIMASGSWNGPSNYNGAGSCPAHINMYQKIQFGWISPTVLTQPQSITGMPNSAMNPVAYRYDTSTPGEYYILENRQKIGFDQYVPGSGLLIYHVSINRADSMNNTVNNRHPQEMYPVCASATTNPTGTVDSYGNINSDGCPFPGTSGNTSFTDYSIPAATAWSGVNTLKPVTEIQQQSGTVSFKFMMPDVNPVTTLSATVTNQTVQLSWAKPSEDVIGYGIYRDNLPLIQLTGKDNVSYSQNNVKSGTYNYCVTALYTGKESTSFCKSVTVAGSQIDDSYLSVSNLSAKIINNNKDVQLNWESPYVSNWVSNAGGLYQWIYYDTTQFVTATRFAQEDVQNFLESKLTKVRFSLYNTACKHTVQIYLANVGSTAPRTPNYTQLVTNPTAPDDNFEVTLNTPVDIVSNQEVWIGVKYELDPMTFVAGADNGPAVQDRNFIYIDKWYTPAVSDDFNFFISGYLQFDNTHLSPPADTWLRSGKPTTYVIYRDNVKLTTTTDRQYVDPQPPAGYHIYCVTVAYDDGKESEPVCVQASNVITAIVPVNNSDGEINIYPNPINKGETLVIHCDYDAVSTLSVYTVSGQLLQQEQMTGSVYNKKMDFDPGIYLLQIKNNTKTFMRKIIVK